MSKLADLPIRNIITQLPRAGWTIGWRRLSDISYIVAHFNGPPVATNRLAMPGLMEQLRIDVGWQMQKGWAGVPSGADGLQYHYVIGANGEILQTRELTSSLWHCGHSKANPKGIAIHVPIGLNEKTMQYQQPTGEQKQSMLTLIHTLCQEFNIPRQKVLGHVELGTTAYCPGTPLMEAVKQYRSSGGFIKQTPVVEHPPLKTMQRYAVKQGIRATIRTGPSRHYDVVRNIKPGTTENPRIIVVDVIKYDESGETIQGEKRWVHMAYVPDQQWNEGFIHMSALELTEDRQEEPDEDDMGILDSADIIGGPFLPDQTVATWLQTKRSLPSEQATALAAAYGCCGRLFGISNWIALHQADKETGGFQSERFKTYNNVAGIGATNDGARGEAFDTIEEAVFVQCLHLYHYADREDDTSFLLAIADANPRLGPLLQSHGRGSAPKWVDLHQKWAVVDAGQPVPAPGDDLAYGMNILNRARRALKEVQ
jgi:hypothetical protein